MLKYRINWGGGKRIKKHNTCYKIVQRWEYKADVRSKKLKEFNYKKKKIEMKQWHMQMTEIWKAK